MAVNLSLPTARKQLSSAVDGDGGYRQVPTALLSSLLAYIENGGQYFLPKRPFSTTTLLRTTTHQVLNFTYTSLIAQNVLQSQLSHRISGRFGEDIDLFPQKAIEFGIVQSVAQSLSVVLCRDLGLVCRKTSGPTSEQLRTVGCRQINHLMYQRVANLLTYLLTYLLHTAHPS